MCKTFVVVAQYIGMLVSDFRVDGFAVIWSH